MHDTNVDGDGYVSRELDFERSWTVEVRKPRYRCRVQTIDQWCVRFGAVGRDDVNTSRLYAVM